MNIKVDQRTIKNLSRKLDKEANKMGEKKLRRKIMVKAAKPVRDIAKNRVPVDLGILKKSIGVLREKKKAPGTYVGPKVTGKLFRESGRPTNLAFMVEYGTVYKTPRPYMRPAAAQGIPQAAKIAEREYRTLANKGT